MFINKYVKINIIYLFVIKQKEKMKNESSCTDKIGGRNAS